MIRQAKTGDAKTIAQLAVQMWTLHTVDELTAEYDSLIADNTAAIFLCFVDKVTIGFAQCQLRNDNVEDTHHSGRLSGRNFCCRRI